MFLLRNFHHWAAAILTASAFFAIADGWVHAAAVEPKIRVLIVDGCSNHDWRLTTRSIRAMSESVPATWF